jgi:hypothetical protein
MKARLFVILCTLIFNVHAAPVSIDLKDASVREFVDLVFKGILKRDYLLGPGIGAETKITISVRGIESDKLHDLGVEALKQHGIETSESGNLLKFTRGGAGGQGGGVSWMAQPGATPGQQSDTGFSRDRVSVPLGQQSGRFDRPASPIGGQVAETATVPDDVEVYFPKFRSVDSLLEAVKLTGVKVSQDKKSTALVFAGSEQRVAVARQIVQQLDKKSGVVDVRAVIIEYSDTSESQQSFSAVLSLLSGKLGLNLAAGVAGANSIKLATKSISAVLTALEGDSRFKQLAEPRLRVVDGSKARVLVGADFPVRGQATTDKTGNAVASIEYKQAGIILELSPQILESSILMSVHQQVSSVALTTSSGIDSPSVNKREVETVVDMKSGEVVMLAGLDNSTEIDTSSGFTWLPSFMKGTNASRGRTQIFLLLEVTRDGQTQI